MSFKELKFQVDDGGMRGVELFPIFSHKLFASKKEKFKFFSSMTVREKVKEGSKKNYSN